MIIDMITMRVDENAVMDEYRKERLKANGNYSVKEYIRKTHLMISPRTFRKKYREWCDARGIKTFVDVTDYMNYLCEALDLSKDVEGETLMDYLRLKNVYKYMELNNGDEYTKMAIASVVVSRVSGKRVDDVITKFTPIAEGTASDVVSAIKNNALEVQKQVRKYETRIINDMAKSIKRDE